MPIGLSDLLLFVQSLEFFARSEEQRNAPDARESHEGIDYSADKCGLTAEQPGDDIEFKKSYASPVESTDYRQYKCYSVHYHGKSPYAVRRKNFFSSESLFCDVTIFFARSEKNITVKF